MTVLLMPTDDQKFNIICLSNQLWDFPNWTNKRHVMTRLAKKGHNVLFVDPPINTGNVFATQMRKGFWPLKRLLTQKKKDESGALVYTPLNLFPQPGITSSLHIERIKSLAESNFNSDLKTILWVYHVQIPFLEKYIEDIDHDILVYDCVDNYEGFPENSNFYSTTVPKSKVIDQEKFLTKKADIVFATAPGLVDKLKKLNDNVHFTPNVGDYEKFKNSEELKDFIPDQLKKLHRPIIGFTGALDQYKFDSNLFRKAAQEYPEYSFVLIGQIALKDKDAGLRDLGLSDLKNVYYLGSVPYEDIQKYFAGFDVFIIPYQLNDYTVGGCFPVKFHDSLAAGLPTVVTNLPAYAPFADVSYISKDYDEFSANIRRAVEEDTPDSRKARQEVARHNNWDGKVENLIKLIQDKIPVKVA